MIETLKSQIGFLVTNNALRAADFQDLISKLDAAELKLKAGNTSSAAGQIKSFLAHVVALINKGSMPPSDGRS